MRRKFLEAEENSNMTPEEKKILQQKLQEEADFEVTKDMMGVDEGDEDSIIDRMNPKSKEDFSVFEQALQKKIQSFSKSDHYSDFIEDLIRNLSVTCKYTHCIFYNLFLFCIIFYINYTFSVSVTDLRKLKATIDNMSIEKVKAEKSDKNKKNKGKGKAKLRLDNSTVSNIYKFVIITSTYSN